MTFKLRDIIKPAVHIFIWCILFAFSFIIAKGFDEQGNQVSPHVWLPLVEAVLIFYLNYFYLIENFIFTKKQYFIFILINALVILFFRFDMYFLHLLTGQDLHYTGKSKNSDRENLHHSIPLSLVKSVFGLIMPVIFALITKAKEIRDRFELKKKEVENIQLQSELQHLKYQLQPHFFFNSLNNIYSLVDISPTIAQETIHNLSKLMQYLLYDTTNEKVDLVMEIDYLKKYIQLMEIRQNEDITTNYKFPYVKNNQYSIAPLLLIPVIENAYKHGVSATHKSQINFEISVANNTLLLISTNSNHPKHQSDISGSGVGLDNLRKRLALIYPGKYTLITEIKEAMFCLTLTLNLENSIIKNNE